MKSIFPCKNNTPTIENLQAALGGTFPFWKMLEDFTLTEAANANAGWHFSGEKFGWSYRISDAKRVIIYLLPREKYFKAAFVFGQKATDLIMQSNIAEPIKSALTSAKPYAEGRGIRIDVRDTTNLEDIQQLIVLKISN